MTRATPALYARPFRSSQTAKRKRSAAPTGAYQAPRSRAGTKEPISKKGLTITRGAARSCTAQPAGLVKAIGSPPVRVYLVASVLMLTACTPSLQLAPVEVDASVVQALDWLRHLSPLGEGQCRTQSQEPRLCRGYVGAYGEHYVAQHHPITLELLAVYEMREWAGGVRAVLVWERPEPVREVKPEGRVL